ncbi:outer membrane protein assembly factor BamD [Tepidamorphus sp. 3E244]|uniref:outer membrane protein assembly factor BamD n=1 Tax=Tepidamorphus sp. 3E244 TaxID=3385498 RepID=UPI0038FC68C4
MICLPEATGRRGRAMRVAALLVAASIVSACSTFPSMPRLPRLGAGEKVEEVVETVPADRLYNEGVALANAGQFRQAAGKFEDVDRQHPYSDLARRSILMTAYAKFEARDYDGAVTAAQRYVTLHPGSEDAAYAQYIIGESYYRQLPTVERDQKATERALSALNDVVQKYPESEYAQQAREKVQVAEDQLAGKEMDVGRYYMKQARFLAAVNRFRTVVEDYQTTRHIEEALHRLTECYMALGVVNEAQTAAAVLGHNYPNSPWYKDSYTLLEKGGYKPEINSGSWLSRIIRRDQA